MTSNIRPTKNSSGREINRGAPQPQCTLLLRSIYRYANSNGFNFGTDYNIYPSNYCDPVHMNMFVGRKWPKPRAHTQYIDVRTVYAGTESALRGGTQCHAISF